MRFVEFGGGLGDVFNAIYNTDRYASLERLAPDGKATVVIVSHNPHVKELFEWHPKRAQLTVMSLGYWLPSEDAEKRRLHGIPPAGPQIRSYQASVAYHPSPEDLAIVRQVRSRGRYVVIASAAGTEPSRDLPKGMREDALEASVGRGYRVVLLGRGYKLFARAEHEWKQGPMVDNLIDRLSVPGTAEMVLGAEAVVTCHSALCILSWHARKPTFVGYPEYVYKRHFERMDEHSFGKDRSTTVHLEFSRYDRSKFAGFLDRLDTKP